MGENGAGKSTMMKCLFGTYQKDEGKIFLNGKEISFSGPKDLHIPRIDKTISSFASAILVHFSAEPVIQRQQQKLTVK